MFTSNKIKLTGITDGYVRSLGSTDLRLFFENDLTVNYPFQVVSKNFPIPYDGIIGKDFIWNFKCTISAYTNSFTIRLANDEVCLPFQSDSSDIWIPPRSQYIRKINVSWESSKVLKNDAIRSGVFSATTLVSKDNPYILLMNTNCKPTRIRFNELEFDDLADYDILSCAGPDSKFDASARASALNGALDLSKTPTKAQSALKQFCAD